MSRIALKHNPLQESLLPSAHESAAIFGDPVSTSDAVKIEGQRAQVEAIMSDSAWHTLPSLAADLKRRFGVRYAETSISARLRGLRAQGYIVERERTRPGSGLYQYRAVKLATHSIDTNGTVRPVEDFGL